MSGALSMLAASTSTTFQVTVGEDVGNYGLTASAGSVAPAEIFGETIESANSNSATHDFRLLLTDSALDANLFRALLVQLSNGTLRRYLASDATYTTPGGGNFNQWQWGTGSSPVWGAADVGAVRSVTLFR